MTDDLKNEAPALSAIPAHDPFVVPDGFFEGFPHLVQARIAKPEPVWRRMLNGVANAHWAWKAAAPVATMVVVALTVRLMNAPVPALAEFTTDITPDELTEWAMTDEDLLAALPDAEAAAIWTEPLNEEECTSYIEYEDLTLDLIIEEL